MGQSRTFCRVSCWSGSTNNRSANNRSGGLCVVCAAIQQLWGVADWEAGSISVLQYRICACSEAFLDQQGPQQGLPPML